MIYTGNYKNFSNAIDGISISGDSGRMVNYQGESYTKLAPKYDFWKKWNDNKGKISEEENNSFYVREYIKNVLINIEPLEILFKLNNRILLCYEESNEFCHRHIVACWLEDKLGIMIPEIEVKQDGDYRYLNRPEEIDELYFKEKCLLKR